MILPADGAERAATAAAALETGLFVIDTADRRLPPRTTRTSVVRLAAVVDSGTVATRFGWQEMAIMPFAMR
ncbi:hypothetical protein [Streptomyces sp. HUAS TT20]|uniref:hypothetical protein n=1 Tax=Streptomyces sp. HUAS TT20 TaxID=3447509 RepID=UPI0021DB4C8A|nr:hypothetical protein [Streptomyces sp. HUAS 15-9]UXY25466.1 hypothetical protein N8I87_02050 [Streptomyces sp. HUAS 15-9]